LPLPASATLASPFAFSKAFVCPFVCLFRMHWQRQKYDRELGADKAIEKKEEAMVAALQVAMVDHFIF